MSNDPRDWCSEAQALATIAELADHAQANMDQIIGLLRVAAEHGPDAPMVRGLCDSGRPE